MSALSALLLLVVLLLAAMVQATEPGPTTNNCPSGSTQEEITTPGLSNGEVPSTGVLVQQAADVLTLWPISPELFPAYQANITAFVAALGSCNAESGCATGHIQIGLYHYHAVGTYVKSEAMKFHLISYSSLITYHPESKSGSNVHAKYKEGRAHAQQPNAQLVPDSEVNAADGYYFGILSTVPYGIFTSGSSSDNPTYYTAPFTPAPHANRLLPANPAGSKFTGYTADSEAAIGMFFCSAASGSGGR